jgi:hypothetical protein
VSTWLIERLGERVRQALRWLGAWPPAAPAAPPALAPADRALLAAAAEGLLWFDPRAEQAMRDTGPGRAEPVDVAALRDAPGGPLVVHSAVDWSLPAGRRPRRVPYLITLAGVRRLSS